MLVDPLEFALELFGRVRDRAQHAEAAGLGDLDHDVAAVREKAKMGTPQPRRSQMGVFNRLLALYGWEVLWLNEYVLHG